MSLGLCMSRLFVCARRIHFVLACSILLFLVCSCQSLGLCTSHTFCSCMYHIELGLAYEIAVSVYSSKVVWVEEGRFRQEQPSSYSCSCRPRHLVRVRSYTIVAAQIVRTIASCENTCLVAEHRHKYAIKSSTMVV
jgi:hypothetical protein